MPNLIETPENGNRSRKPPYRHRRTYERAGQFYATHLTEHLIAADLAPSQFDAYLQQRKAKRRVA